MFSLIRSFRIQYLSLLAVYFAVGLAGLSAVTSTFFIRDHIHLSATELISLGIFTSLPWSIKMVFGAVIDGVRIFGSNRKSYIYLGQLLVVLGIVGTVDHASTQILISHLGEYGALLLTGLLGVVGVVISDIVVDTMAIEITDNPAEIGMIQVWSRIAQSAGGLLGAALTGYLATNYQAADVYTASLVCPAIALLGTMLTPLNRPSEPGTLDLRIVGGGIAFGLVAVLSGLFGGQYGTLIMFLLSAAILTYLFSRLKLTRPFIYAMLGLFLYRVSPGIGPGLSWFYTGTLGFDAEFLGHLSLISSATSIAILVLLARHISEGNFLISLGVIAGLATLLSVPDILVFYDVWNTQAIARQVILVDSSLIAPLANLSMIPLGIIIAKAAPAAKRAVYISLTASLMNLALVGGEVGTQILNQVYMVTRENQSELGMLMTVSLVIGILITVVALGLLYRTQERR